MSNIEIVLWILAVLISILGLAYNSWDLKKKIRELKKEIEKKK